MAKKKRSDSESSNHDDGVQFRISEVSSLLNVSASTLRQWENVGLTAPSRTQGGYRVYSGRQVEHLKRIQSLRVKNGLNIGAIRQSLALLKSLLRSKTHRPPSKCLHVIPLSGILAVLVPPASEHLTGSDPRWPFLPRADRWIARCSS